MKMDIFTADDCRWIDPSALPAVSPGTKAVLFGAGEGSVELFKINHTLPVPLEIEAIADNDSTMHGRELHGVKIIHPYQIKQYENAVIIITTISGAEPVARQLETMGYRRGTDFHNVGIYPTSHTHNLNLFLDFNRTHDIVKPGGTILHVGPGGFLGLECSLYALGYDPISMDAYSFGVNYPDVTDQKGKYDRSLMNLLANPHIACDKSTVSNRHDSLFVRKNGRCSINESCIKYFNPSRFSDIPLPDASVDAVISFGVLEHVRDPEKVVGEITRVLKTGGSAFHKIITRDHRSFSKISGYHPWSYLNHSAEEWEAINEGKFYQNRLLPHDWKQLFGRRMTLGNFQGDNGYPMTEALYDEISRHRPGIKPEDAQFVGCQIVAHKM